MDKSLENLVERFVNIGQQTQPIPKYASTSGADLPAAYILRHYKTGKIYVGSSGQIGHRLFKHKNFLKRDRHQILALQEAYNSNPDIHFLVLVTANREEAFDIEQYLLDKYWSTGLLFNTSPNARLSGKGLQMSEENRKRISILHTGRKHRPESILKMSLAQKGKIKSEEHVKRIHESRRGWKPTKEHAQKVSLALKGVPRSLEDKERIRVANLKRSKPVEINGTTYDSIRHAARVLGLDKNKVKHRIKSSSPEYANWKMKD